MVRVERGTFTDRLSVLFHGRKGNPVIYRQDGKWDGRPTGGEVVGSSFSAGTIDVRTSNGTAVELTPSIFEETGAKWGLNRHDIG